MKLSDAITGYWLDKRINFSKHTITGYTVIFDRLVAFLHNPEIEQVTTNDVRRFLGHIADEHDLSAKSLANTWITLSSFWTWAETELKITHVIRGKIKRPRYNTPTVETFNQAEIRELLKAAEFTDEYTAKGGKRTRNKRLTSERDRAVIMVLLDTGIRAQELCDLTIADYDEKRGRLHIRHGKGDKGRFVVMGMRTRKAIWRMLAERGKVSVTAPLFATGTEEHLQRDNLRHTLQRIGDRAKVRNVYPHRFRHTFAIGFLRAGGNVLLLKELLGHESIEMVMRYAHIAEQDIEQGADFSPADHWKI